MLLAQTLYDNQGSRIPRLFRQPLVLFYLSAKELSAEGSSVAERLYQARSTFISSIAALSAVQPLYQERSDSISSSAAQGGMPRPVRGRNNGFPPHDNVDFLTDVYRGRGREGEVNEEFCILAMNHWMNTISGILGCTGLCWRM